MKKIKVPLAALQSTWNYPTTIHFGVGKIKILIDACKQLNVKDPLLVTDAGLAKLPLIKDIIKNNKKTGLNTEIFSDVKSNPTGNNVQAGVKAFKQGQHDGVIAIGGGSGLDAGKAIALMAGQTRPLWDFEDIGKNWSRVNEDRMAPCIAIPTTAGTGSEVGRASVIVDESVQLKKIIFHPKMMPQIVIADPELTQGLSPNITAATGIDAFVHNLEAYCVLGFHPIADGIALEGMRLIKNWLPIAFADGNNLEARSNMLAASCMGAVAFQKGLGGIHALAHPLGALYDKHHGLLNAILLPYVLLRNRPAIEAKLIHIGQYLELSNYTFEGVLDWLLDFRHTLNIPNTLTNIGIKIDYKDRISQMAIHDPSAAGNPILLSAEDYATIFDNAVYGVLK